MEEQLEQDTYGSELQLLLGELLELRYAIIKQAHARLDRISCQWPGKEKEESAVNLCLYLAFRKHDIRPVQDKLESHGLSSLGRGESNILKNIDRIINTLQQASDISTCDYKIDDSELTRFPGREILEQRTDSLFGQSVNGYYTRIMITLPSAAAENYGIIKGLIDRDMDSARINCAHGSEYEWKQMVEYLESAKKESSKDCRLFMDVAGLKIRTGSFAANRKETGEKVVLFEDDIFELRCDAKTSVISNVNPMTAEERPAIISCTSNAFLSRVKIGDSVWIDDGKLGSVIEDIFETGIRLRVTHAGPKGVQIKADKGINFPETRLELPVLTHKDLKDLDFICKYADMLGVSFVQSAADLDVVMNELSKRQSNLPIIAKIENRQAVENLPEILLKGLSYEGEFAIMIARGDLAVELGSVRMAEIQEEILWLCEAANVPVIWATQVLESLAKKGRSSRPEITDAAMSVRAECVMLNKGKYINSAVEILRDILNNMQTHQYKKVSRLRPLHW